MLNDPAEWRRSRIRQNAGFGSLLLLSTWPGGRVLFLLLILALCGMALTVIIWVITLFLQGYYYTQPTPGIAWQAPAAGFVLGLFFTFWCMLILNSTVTSVQDLPYDTIFRFSPQVNKYQKPVRDLWVVKKGVKEPIHYKLKLQPTKTSVFVEAQSGRSYSPSAVEEIILKEDGKEIHFLPLPRTEGGGYRIFADENGWTIREYPQSGPTDNPEAFRWSRFLMNILLNFLHFVLWFVCLWVLVRFQWSHALGLAVVMWLIMTVAVLPMIFEESGKRAQATPAGAREKAGLLPIQRELIDRDVLQGSDCRAKVAEHKHADRVADTGLCSFQTS
jgi:hypothetical protein